MEFSSASRPSRMIQQAPAAPLDTLLEGTAVGFGIALVQGLDHT